MLCPVHQSHLQISPEPVSFVSPLPFWHDGGHQITMNPHYICCGVPARLSDRGCLEIRPLPSDPQGPEREDWGQLSRVCAQREGHLRKWGWLAVCANTGPYLLLILISPYVPREGIAKPVTLTRLKLCVFEVMYFYLQCGRAFIWPTSTQPSNRPKANTCFCFVEQHVLYFLYQVPVALLALWQGHL